MLSSSIISAPTEFISLFPKLFQGIYLLIHRAGMSVVETFLSFKSETLESPLFAQILSTLLLVVGISYVFYIMIRSLRLTPKFQQVFTNIKDSSPYKFFESVQAFIYGYLIKMIIKYIDTEAGKKFSIGVDYVIDAFRSALAGSINDGTVVTVPSLLSILFTICIHLIRYSGLIVLLCFVIDLIIHAFKGDSADGGFKLLINSYNRVTQYITCTIGTISHYIWITLVEIYYSIQHPFKTGSKAASK